DSGAAEGILYFIMPYVEGGTLRDLLNREGMLPLEEALRIGKEITEALSHAHSMDVVHRDIKPANILLRDGHALVADFGIAKAVEESAGTTLTQTGTVIGTPAYLSPEQAGGQAKLDSRSDLYSLGCVFHEMLGGEPPFTGPTTQSILAKHLNETSPSLATVRPDLSPGVVLLVRKLLSKVPADRYQSATELLRVLEDPKVLEKGPPPPFLHRVLPWPWARRIAQVAILAGSAVLANKFFDFWPPLHRGILDPNKVVVFPLGDRGGGGLNGANASLAIIMALEHAEPLRPLDAWDRLSPPQKENIDLLDPGRAREIALAWGAGHYMTGAVTRRGDSLGVSLNLYATGPDSLVASESEPGSLADFPGDGPGMDQALSQLGIGTTIALLPALIDPGRRIDLSTLTDRDPEAIVQWIYGEREYRLSHFETALEFYEDALVEDSLLAPAAAKAGQAATCVKDWDRGRDLLELALRNPQSLTLRHRQLARGLLFFTNAEPDSAAFHIRAALETDPDWSEAWMALGEVYHHFFPRDLVVDSTDAANFRRAAELDPAFHPPLIHLAEAAIRNGEVVEAARYLRRLSDGLANPVTLGRLRLSHRCVDQGLDEASWEAAAQLDPLNVLSAGLGLAAGGKQPACAKAAFRAVLQSSSTAGNIRWGAYRGLQGILVAEGRYEEALSLLDEALGEGHGTAQYYLGLDVIAGAPWEDRALEVETTVRERYGDTFEGLRPEPLWYLGVWLAWTSDREGTLAVHRALLNAEARGDLEAGSLARALEGDLRLISGDTIEAIRAYSEVLPRGNQIALEWSVSSPLPIRHLRLAELLLATKQPDEAIRVASFFDHVEPVVFLPFLRRSLQIRLEAARILGSSRVQEYEQRLSKLGVDDRSL
ncbi:MAG: serine/threonine-protein kinase, partial [Gemmatimonadales bacterium]